MKLLRNKSSKGVKVLTTWLLPLLLLAVSCSDDESRVGVKEDTFITLEFTTEKNKNSLGEGVDLLENREVRIEHIDVFVFKREGDQDLFAYKAKGGEPVFDNEGYYKIDVSLRKSESASEQYSLVLLANVGPFGPLTDKIGVAKEELLRSFQFNSSSTGGTYIWLNSENKSFPMWGESVEAKVIDENIAYPTIRMLRAISRVDLGFNYQVDSNGTESFSELKKEGSEIPYTLSSVYVYRSVNKGVISPYSQNIDENLIATTPSLPNLESTKDYNDPILFNAFEPTTTVVKRQIYLAENKGGAPKNNDEVTSLVLGLQHPDFKKLNSNGTEIRYFRGDIMNQGDVETHPILRNRRYIINIQKINGDGAETPEEANKSDVDGVIEVEVEDWNQVDYNLDIIGEEYLTIKSREMYVLNLINEAESYLNSFETNISSNQIFVSETKNSEKTKELSLKGLTIALEEQGVRLTKLANTHLEESVSFYIHAGKHLLIPMTIKPIDKPSFTLEIYDFKADSKGSYKVGIPTTEANYLHAGITYKSDGDQDILVRSEVKNGIYFEAIIPVRKSSDIGSVKSFYVPAYGTPEKSGSYSYTLKLYGTKIHEAQITINVKQ